MSICKFISEEIEAIQRDELDIDNLDPENYEIYLERLNRKVLALQKIKNMLGADISALRMLDRESQKGTFNLENLSLGNFASKLEEITKETIVFIGNIDIRESREGFQIPSSLKIIIGNLDMFDADISTLELDFVESLSAFSCKKLKRLSVKNIVSLTLDSCPILADIGLLELTLTLKIKKCDSLTISGINSLEASKSIRFTGPNGYRTIVSDFSPHEIDSKFIFTK